MSGEPVSISELKRRTLKPVDAWWTVLVIDPLALRLVWLQQRIVPGLNPDVVTVFSLLAGVASAIAFYSGELVAGALLFQVSFLLDCVDGKIARLRDKDSTYGAFLDGLVNHVVYLLALLGLGLFLRNDFAVAVSTGALLVLRPLHIYVNNYIERPNDETWTPFVTQADSWLAKHRLLPPGSFPDKQSLLFTIGPTLGILLPALYLNVFLEVALLVAKLTRTKSRL